MARKSVLGCHKSLRQQRRGGKISFLKKNKNTDSLLKDVKGILQKCSFQKYCPPQNDK